MSGSASADLEAAILGHTLGYSTLPATSQAFVALCMASATPTNQLPGIEVAGGNYTRMAALFGPGPSVDTATNIQTVEFPVATETWGDIGFFEIWSASSGGTRLYWGPLADPADGITPTTETVVIGETMRFSAGALNVLAIDLTSSGSPWLPLSGGTLTGPLLLAADPSAALGAATKQYVDTNVTYTATGGTTPRHLADHLGDQISIKDLGAIGDGFANDSGAFTLAAAQPSGTTIYIPANTTCIITPQLWSMGAKQINFVGASRHTSIIKLAPGSTVSNTMFFYNGADSPSIRDLTFDYNGAAYSGGVGWSFFAANSCLNPSVRNVSVLGVPNNAFAISFTASTNLTVEGCYVTGAAPASAYSCKAVVTFSSIGPCLGGRIVNNTFVGCNTLLARSTMFYIAGNDVSGWGYGSGITTGQDADSWGSVIIGNRCHDPIAALDASSIAPCGIEHWGHNSVLSSNACWNCTGAGISNGGHNTMVVGNLCWDNNTILSATGAGILAAASSSTWNAAGSTYVGNKCWDSGVGRQYYGYNASSSLFDLPISLHGNQFAGVTDNMLLNAQGSTQIEPCTLNASVAAAGGAQLAATILTDQYNVVTSATAGTGDGVKLPITAFVQVVIINRSGISIRVWPGTGGAIDGGTPGAAVTLANGAVGRYFMTSTTSAFTV